MAKKIQREVHCAFDGKEFATEQECAAYEASSPIGKLEGLTLEELHAGINYGDKAISKALETAGNAARRNRIEAGDKKGRGAPKKETV